MSPAKLAAPAECLPDQVCERFLQVADVGALCVDDNACIVMANPFFGGILLYAPNELKGRGLWEISHVLPGEAVLHAVHVLRERGHLPCRELPLNDRRGMRVHFDYHLRGQTANGSQLLECRFHDLAVGDVFSGAPQTALRHRRQRILDDAGFENAANGERARTQDEGLPLSLLSVGIDHFNAVGNGKHAPIPLAFRGFAMAASRVLRATDTVGWLDRNGFHVLLPSTPMIAALRTAERLRTAIATMEWPHTERRITASIGVVTSRTGRSSFRLLCTRADSKRDDARVLGGNRVQA